MPTIGPSFGARIEMGYRRKKACAIPGPKTVRRCSVALSPPHPLADSPPHPLSYKTGMEKNYFVHESSYVDEPCEIGEGTKIWHFSHVMSNSRIGRRCNIGQNVVISPQVTIGDNVKIQNNVSIYTGVILEDDVFCGPSMVFTNVVNPRSAVVRKSEYRPTLVQRGATIGANATVICAYGKVMVSMTNGSSTAAAPTITGTTHPDRFRAR